MRVNEREQKKPFLSGVLLKYCGLGAPKRMPNYPTAQKPVFCGGNIFQNS